MGEVTAAPLKWGGTVVPNWLAPLGPNAQNVQAYAYDWAAPTTTSSTRVVLADRPRSGTEFTHHGRLAKVVFGDGHGGTIKPGEQVPSGQRTYDQSGGATSFSALNKEAGNDDIYNDADDTSSGVAGLMIGKGSATRSWVK